MLGIFLYGCVVFGIVAVAAGLIVWGIRTERRDRRLLAQEMADKPLSRSVADTIAGDAPHPSGAGS